MWKIFRKNLKMVAMFHGGIIICGILIALPQSAAFKLLLSMGMPSGLAAGCAALIMMAIGSIIGAFALAYVEAKNKGGE